MESEFFCQSCGNIFSVQGGLGLPGVCSHCGSVHVNELRKDVDLILNQAKSEAMQRARELPLLPRKAGLLIYNEWGNVRSAYILAQYSAALVLGTAFLEYILNKALGNTKTITLHSCIDLCRKNKIIDVDTAKKLVSIKEFIRNRYAHGDLEGIAGKAPVKLTMVTIKKGKATVCSSANSTVDQFSFTQAMQKEKHDMLFSRPTLQLIWRISCVLIQKNEHFNG